MTEQGETPFVIKCEILSEIWMDYRTDEKFQDFVKYNDLGLPLAYAVASDLVELLEESEHYIEETFDLLLTSLGLTDTGFDTLEQVLESAGK